MIIIDAAPISQITLSNNLALAIVFAIVWTMIIPAVAVIKLIIGNP
ncbi:MAG: hypothetical protein AAFY21_21035 [Cyanobacteria bacterium J06641_2]